MREQPALSERSESNGPAAQHDDKQDERLVFRRGKLRNARTTRSA